MGIITYAPSAYKIFMYISDSKILSSNSYDPDDGVPYGSNNGIVQWKWDIWNYNEGDGYYIDQGKDVNSSTTFSPSALEIGAGRYGVDLNVLDNDGILVNGYPYYQRTQDWSGTRDFYIPGIKYLRDQSGEDEHCLPTGIGETFYYYLLPGEGAEWEPDVMCLYIKDASDNYVYMRYLIGSVINNPDIPLKGESAALEWNGLGNQGSYNGQPLPPGNYTVTLYINKSGYTAYETNPLTIYGVTNVEWKAWPGNSQNDIDNLKIFPEKYSYNDTSTMRHRVQVKATISPSISDIDVYFKCFDVDDPSSSDPDGSSNTSGPDNFGGTSYGFVDSDNSDSTNSDGEAFVGFEVTKQPGDNFRIAASMDSSLLNSLTQSMVDGGTIPAGVKLSPILTVWRKLWIEQDSMSTVATTGSEKNLVSGTGATYSAYNTPSSGQTTVYLGIDLPDEFEDNDQFERGRYIAGGGSYRVISSEDRWVPNDNDIIVVSGNATGAGSNFNLYDEDWDFSTSPPTPQITLPQTAFISPTISYLASAYIEPVDADTLHNCSSIVPFDRNLPCGDIDSGYGTWNNSKLLTSSSDFWCAFVCFAYQPEHGNDNDPDPESAIMGKTSTLLSNQCVLYLEAIRDAGFSGSLGDILFHELGHTGGLVWSRVESLPPGHCGDSDCIMSEDSVGSYLCDKCIKNLREKPDW